MVTASLMTPPIPIIKEPVAAEMPPALISHKPTNGHTSKSELHSAAADSAPSIDLTHLSAPTKHAQRPTTLDTGTFRRIRSLSNFNVAKLSHI